MRHLLAAVFTWAPLLTAARLIPSVQQGERVAPSVPGHNAVDDPITLVIPWTASGADDFLVFEIQAVPAADLHTSDVTLNGQHLDIAWDQSGLTTSSARLYTQGSRQGRHAVDVEVNGSSDVATSGGDLQQHLTIEVVSVDDQPSEGITFTIILDPASPQPLQDIIWTPVPEMHDPKQPTHSLVSVEPSLLDEDFSYDDEKHGFGQDDVSFDFALEATKLHLLEEEAERLRVVIQSKKNAIAYHLREDRDRMSLQKLLDECDTLVCTARVIALRICDKVGAAPAYTHIQDPHLQRLIEIDGEKKPAKSSEAVSTLSAAATGNGGAQHMRLPAHVTQNGTAASLYSLQAVDLINPSNPLVRALQIIAAALGLTALCAYVRRRCMSVRKQVDRAADREERRNARAYRRAARRAYIRKRWDGFMAAINCFRPAEEGARSGDYEEKRALILQDAFLEQLDDLEQAEKGDIMEAEIRELRHAREIVESLVRVGEHRFAVAAPIHDPPPPMVPLPYTPATRSRASTHTLPSYTSESLPDYSSRAPSLGGSSCDSVADGFTDYTPATRSEGEHASVPSACSEDGRVARSTPTSSVMNVSPRVSEDTLWTRLSRDMRGP